MFALSYGLNVIAIEIERESNRRGQKKETHTQYGYNLMRSFNQHYHHSGISHFPFLLHKDHFRTKCSFNSSKYLCSGYAFCMECTCWRRMKNIKTEIDRTKIGKSSVLPPFWDSCKFISKRVGAMELHLGLCKRNHDSHQEIIEIVNIFLHACVCGKPITIGQSGWPIAAIGFIFFG